jgi:hypothetical protein
MCSSIYGGLLGPLLVGEFLAVPVAISDRSLSIVDVAVLLTMAVFTETLTERPTTSGVLTAVYAERFVVHDSLLESIVVTVWTEHDFLGPGRSQTEVLGRCLKPSVEF